MTDKRNDRGAAEGSQQAGVPIPDAGETIRIKDERVITRERQQPEDEGADAPGAMLPYSGRGEDDYADDPDEGGGGDWLADFMSQLSPTAKITVVVKRMPDGYENRGRFNEPCDTVVSCESVRLTQGMELDDLYTIVRERERTGGVFSFQLRSGPGFTNRVWEETLSNPRNLPERQQPAPVAPVAPVAPPVHTEPQRHDPLRDAVEGALIARVKSLTGDVLNPAVAAQQTAQTKDPLESMMDTITKVNAFKQALGVDGARSEEPWYGAALRSIVETLAGALAPALPQLVVAYMMRPQEGQQAGAPPNGATPAGQLPQAGQGTQQQQQQQQPTDALSGALRLLVIDATRNAPTGRAAATVCDVSATNVQYATVLEQLLNQPSAQLVQLLAQMTSQPLLAEMPHVYEWFDELKGEVKERIAERQAQQSEQSEEEQQPGA